jgi:hypothetical protein
LVPLASLFTTSLQSIVDELMTTTHVQNKHNKP